MSFRAPTHVIPSAARNLPPSQSVRGPGGCSNTSFPRRRESRGEGKRKSWQSFPHHGNHGSKSPPFAFTPCHSEHSEESLTSFSRRRESRGEGKGKSWQSFKNHGNHGSKPPPFAKRKGARAMLQHVIPAQAGIQRGREGKIMAIIQKSWQSWFKTSPLRRA